MKGWNLTNLSSCL